MTASKVSDPRPSKQTIRERALLLLAVAIDLFLFSDIAAPASVALGGPHTSPLLLVGYATVGYALLLFRRRARFAVLLVLCVYSAAAALFLSYSPIAAVLIALSSLVAHRTLRWCFAGTLAAALTSATWVYGEDWNNKWSFTWVTIVEVQIGYLVIIAVAAGIGGWRQISERQSEARRVEAARAAVTAERHSLARELHDIVAHAVTLMVLQASGAKAVMASDPIRANNALEVVEKTGTQAMAELRRLLGVLRTSSDQNQKGYEEAGLPPGLDRLPDLVQAVTTAGLQVSVRTEGEPHPIDRSVDAAAYRIVSESLTNVTKHSGSGTSVEVRIVWTTTHLNLEVTDDGAGAAPDPRLSTGNGLLGLTERVVLVGGSFEARPRATGGYEVHASLPLPISDLSHSSAFLVQ